MTPDSLLQARALIGSGQLDAFSFDIFDTFLLRRCTGPDGVIERTFHHAPISLRHRHTVEAFIQHRMLAEYKGRSRKIEAKQPPELTINEIYARFPTHVYGLPADARRALVAAEFQAELDLCVLNRDIHDLYQEARGRGLKVGFLSDTYWSGPQLARLIEQVAPGLPMDFLYTSCDHGWGKAHGLFRPYLDDHGLAPERAAHMGDNIVADVMVPEKLGIKTIHYPQAPQAMAPVFQREATTIRLMQAERDGIRRRGDDGLHVLRRLALAGLDDKAGADHLAATGVIGPVLAAFNRMIEARVAELEAEGRRVKLLFLGRDGYLPLQLWTLLNGGNAHYVEINRRVALVACADTVEPLQKFFRGMPRANAQSVADLLKADIPAVTAFFQDFPEGVTDGNTLADALPDLIQPEELSRLSAALRDKLLVYLRANVDGFDTCSDLILVDLGYSGTIQRAMRGLLDCAGIEKGLHGVYVISVDDNFIDFAGNDSVRSLIDDTVIPPMSKRALLRNVSIFERFCAAPWGSVRSYEGGRVEHEDELRSPKQVEFSDRMQAGCLRFAELYASVRRDWRLDPFADVEAAQLWGAALLSRFLLLPTAEEQEALGAVQIDVNLGSKVIATVIDTPYVERLMETMPFPKVCTVPMPPMWLAGSIASVSPFAGYAYALAGFGLIPEDVLGDSAFGQVNVVIITDDLGEVTVPVGLSNTGFGDLRLRIPVLSKHTRSRIAVPLARIGRSGVVRSLTIQQGDNSAGALNDRQVRPLPLAGIDGMGAHLHGGYFRATEDDAHLLLTAPASSHPLSILTLTVTPLDKEMRRITC